MQVHAGMFAIFLAAAGCADRPLWLPGTGPGAGGGGNGANGMGGANGSDGTNGANGGNGDGTPAPPVPRLLRPGSTSTVTSRRPRLAWDMTGVAGPASVSLCADRGC